MGLLWGLVKRHGVSYRWACGMEIMRVSSAALLIATASEIALPPSSAMACTFSVAFVSLLFGTRTVAPSSANRIALALPIPAPAPVTAAILSCKRPIAPPGKRVAHALPRRRLLVERSRRRVNAPALRTVGKWRHGDRQGFVEGKRGLGRGDYGGRRIIEKKKN